jgi:hypothetical protein
MDTPKAGKPAKANCACLLHFRSIGERRIGSLWWLFAKE